MFKNPIQPLIIEDGDDPAEMDVSTIDISTIRDMRLDTDDAQSIQSVPRRNYFEQFHTSDFSNLQSQDSSFSHPLRNRRGAETPDLEGYRSANEHSRPTNNPQQQFLRTPSYDSSNSHPQSSVYRGYHRNREQRSQNFKNKSRFGNGNDMNRDAFSGNRGYNHTNFPPPPSFHSIPLNERADDYPRQPFSGVQSHLIPHSQQQRQYNPYQRVINNYNFISFPPSFNQFYGYPQLLQAQQIAQCAQQYTAPINVSPHQYDYSVARKSKISKIKEEGEDLACVYQGPPTSGTQQSLERKRKSHASTSSSSSLNRTLSSSSSGCSIIETASDATITIPQKHSRFAPTSKTVPRRSCQYDSAPEASNGYLYSAMRHNRPIADTPTTEMAALVINGGQNHDDELEDGEIVEAIETITIADDPIEEISFNIEEDDDIQIITTEAVHVNVVQITPDKDVTVPTLVSQSRKPTDPDYDPLLDEDDRIPTPIENSRDDNNMDDLLIEADN